jgi:hypothetical protein
MRLVFALLVFCGLYATPSASADDLLPAESREHARTMFDMTAKFGTPTREANLPLQRQFEFRTPAEALCGPILATASASPRQMLMLFTECRLPYQLKDRTIEILSSVLFTVRIADGAFGHDAPTVIDDTDRILPRNDIVGNILGSAITLAVAEQAITRQ